MHVRTQIRQAAVNRLLNLPLTHANVYGARAYPLPSENLPALFVTADNEEVEHGLNSVLLRTLDLTVRAVVMTAGAGLEDQLDEIAAQVETAIASGALIAGSTQCLLASIEVEPPSGDGEQAAGSLVMTYRTNYLTATAAPGSAL